MGDTFLYYFLERGMIMEGQAVTTNPWLIMAINMTVVFAVLIALGILMEIVHLIDPTKKKKKHQQQPLLLLLQQLLL